MRIRTGLWIALLSALMLSGCSFATRFAYNHLDWLVKREMHGYIQFSDAQEDRFETGFQDWWRWHRQTQLPQYATALRAYAAAAEQGVELDDLQGALQQLDGFLNAALERALPTFADLLRDLSDEQVVSLLAAMREETDADASEWQDLDLEQRNQRKLRQFGKSLRRQLGRLNDSQQQRLESWALQRTDMGEIWLASERRWQQALAEVLNRRRELGFDSELRSLLLDYEKLWTPEHREAEAHNRALSLQMLADIFSTLSRRQHRHYQHYLLDFAEDFEKLAAD